MMTTIHNPIIWADVPDIDTIRVNEKFYMVSTSMHSMPGCPIMRSKDLAHWEIVNYVFETFEDCPSHNLEDGKGIYANGSWAASLKYENDTFYVAFNCNDTHHFYIYKTNDIEEGEWERICKIEGFLHDPALFFEDDGTPYIIYGCGEIQIVELKKDLTGIKEDGLNQLLLSTPKENIGLRCEGGHAYKINHEYYLFYIEWPLDGKKSRREICYRAQNLLGPYERKIVFDDDMGYKGQGIAQGCIFDTLAGEWFAMLFQDHHAVGRIPYVLPMEWEDGWPNIGVDGKTPEEFQVNLEEEETQPLVISDTFEYTSNQLAKQWQWNHNPNNSLWSVIEHPGFLRLKTGTFAKRGFIDARNTLTQRTIGPACEIDTKLHLQGMKSGDCAGLAAIQGDFGLIGIRCHENHQYELVMCHKADEYYEEIIETKKYFNDTIYLKIHFDFLNSVDRAYFFYSLDGRSEERRVGKEC